MCTPSSSQRPRKAIAKSRNTCAALWNPSGAQQVQRELVYRSLGGVESAGRRPTERMSVVPRPLCERSRTVDRYACEQGASSAARSIRTRENADPLLHLGVDLPQHAEAIREHCVELLRGQRLAVFIHDEALKRVAHVLFGVGEARRRTAEFVSGVRCHARAMNGSNTPPASTRRRSSGTRCHHTLATVQRRCREPLRLHRRYEYRVKGYFRPSPGFPSPYSYRPASPSPHRRRTVCRSRRQRSRGG